MINNQKVLDVLHSVGLHKNEILIYLDLIRTGKSSALDISKRTKIHRTNVYDTVDKLINRGIVTQAIENNRRTFYPIEPRNLLNFHKQLGQELEEIIPEIDLMHKRSKEIRKVVFYEGLASIKNILMNILEDNNPLFVFGLSEISNELLGDFIIKFNRIRESKKLFVKSIYNFKNFEKLCAMRKSRFSEIKYIPSSFDSMISTIISGNCVVLIFWETPISAITIHNSFVVKTYKKNFDILWENAKQVINK
ncbi:MAG: helix-turn-helix domain-containing protein [Nanoarchaeota archaeon]|nr:helix-turn-helix domain-containing protein [Nanoarchaeota archaeon]